MCVCLYSNIASNNITEKRHVIGMFHAPSAVPHAERRGPGTPSSWTSELDPSLALKA